MRAPRQRSKRPRPRWKTKLGFAAFKAHLEKLGHVLLLDEKQWLCQVSGAFSKPPIQCGTCGALNQTALIHNIVNNGRGIGCACRHTSKWRVPNPSTKNDCKKGDDAVNYILKRIQTLDGWEAAKMREGTEADLAVRRTGEENWIPIQVKSCSTGKGCFPNLKGYSNHLLCLVELTDGKGGEVWIAPRNCFPSTQVGNIRGPKYKARYEAYRVDSDLEARLESLATNPDVVQRPLDVLNVPSQWKHRKEHLSQTLFAQILESFGHAMRYPTYENTATDWFLNGRAVQDKTVGYKIGAQYQVILNKNNGRGQVIPYSQGDNDLYLIFVLEQAHTETDFQCSVTDYLTNLVPRSSLRGCFMFHEADLIKTGHIQTVTKQGKVKLYLPVPDADGKFQASIPRVHDFKPRYFHKTEFKRLVERMVQN